ncbi:MAG: TRAP transporter large permease [Tissierellia bacterium]|nr:TRAP transporter large permease [Tissierellia bacterium]
MVILLLVVLFVCIALGIPIAISIGLSSLAYLVAAKLPIVLVAQRSILGAYTYPFLALPFFVFSGMLMEQGGITKRLMRLAAVFVGHVRGGLAAVTVVASTLFGALCGSGVGATAAVGSIMIPSMKDEGYSGAFSAALLGCCGTLASLIPPSLTIVVIGVTGGLSVGSLFLAGVLPGVLTALGLIGVSAVVSKKRGYGGQEKASAKERIEALKDSILALLAPVIILGGIWGGIFTVTEAAAVVVVYSFIIAVFVYKEVSFKDLPEITYRAVITSIAVMFIVGVAALFGWIVTAERVPQLLANFFLSISPNKWVFMLLINLLLLILGTFMESTALVIILIPVLLPVVYEYGIDPIHFCTVFLLNLCIGSNTPPLGVTLMTASKIADVSFTESSRAVIPFVASMVVILLLTIFIPQFSTFLPKLLMGN